MSVDSYFDWLIPRFYPPISRNVLRNQKVRGPKCMRVFISRLYLIYSRRNSRFPAQISSLLFEGLLHGIVWEHQWFWGFFPWLEIHSKTKFSWLYPIIIVLFSLVKSVESESQKVHESFYFTVGSYLRPENFKISCRDCFPALRSFITRVCMGTSVILSFFS